MDVPVLIVVLVILRFIVAFPVSSGLKKQKICTFLVCVLCSVNFTAYLPKLAGRRLGGHLLFILLAVASFVFA